ncbi:MAG: hypothetical protein ABI588_06870 [Arenimonas sp.]
MLAEFIGTALLLACVVGSGIMGVNLSQGNNAIALLANAAATAGGFVLAQLVGALLACLAVKWLDVAERAGMGS